MPNHCDCVLTILGPDDDIRAFVLKANGKTRPNDAHTSIFAFHALVPLPDDYGVGCTNGSRSVRQQSDTWGTKWGAYNLPDAWTVTEGRADLTFTTAWGVARTFFRQVARYWPTLTFFLTYSEESPSRGWCMWRGAHSAHFDDESKWWEDYGDGEDYPGGWEAHHEEVSGPADELYTRGHEHFMALAIWDGFGGWLAEKGVDYDVSNAEQTTHLVELWRSSNGPA